MGGGGVMRSVASKVAGFSGVVQGGIRGSAVLPPVEQSVRNVSVPVSASISSSQSVKAAADVVSVHRPAWEIDDWEFAGFEDEPVMAAPMPRIVFGGVPSFQEAKEATAELKDALDQVYLSSPKSSTTDQAASDSETKSRLISETKPNDSIPTHALQAFRYLSESPDVQKVVTSIACDQDVWSAAMRNPVLQQFMDSHQTVEELPDPVFFKEMEDEMTDSSQSGEAKSGFRDILKNIKFKVMNMVSNVSSFLNNIFGLPSDANGDAKTIPIDMTLGASVMGLAVLVIMVVVLKRV